MLTAFGQAASCNLARLAVAVSTRCKADLHAMGFVDTGHTARVDSRAAATERSHHPTPNRLHAWT